MILENLELEEREAAQRELGDLAEKLAKQGFDTRLAPLDGSFHAKLEESADRVALDVLNVVLEEAESQTISAAVGAITATLTSWARGRRHFRDRDEGQATAVIWGPDGRPLREVRLPEPDQPDD
jgi:hypothetical protein